MQRHDHEIFMQRALELATLGVGHVSPNPLVGCVVVYEGKIIGEGWHQKYGESHAEVNAINSVEDKDLLTESTVYVTLEPCAHHGNTPPCCDLLINKKVKRVVISNVDVNPVVQNKGIAKMKAAGIEVVEGILQDQGLDLNKRFFSTFNRKRPYIILKWAQTQDGFIARDNYDSKWISNEYSRFLVHKWRSDEAAIMVGTNTARYDNPKLNVRGLIGRDPVRIVIDRNLQLEPDLFLFDNSQRTICYNLLKSEQVGETSFVKLPEGSFLKELLEDVLKRGLNSILIEGGAYTLSQLINQNSWDEARVFIGDVKFGSGIAAPVMNSCSYEEVIKGDRLLVYKNHNI